MNNKKLMFAAMAACVALAACDKKDFDAVTGTTDYTSVSVSIDPSTFTIDTGVDNAVAFSPVATTEPQGVVIANGTTNMTYSIANSSIAEINGDGNLQGDAAGTTTVTITYTDVNHDFATTTTTATVHVVPGINDRVVR